MVLAHAFAGNAWYIIHEFHDPALEIQFMRLVIFKKAIFFKIQIATTFQGCSQGGARGAKAPPHGPKWSTILDIICQEKSTFAQKA